MKPRFYLCLFLLFALGSCFACSLEEKISQMIIVGYDGDSVNSLGYRRILREMKKGEVSGVIVFQKNIKSKDEITKMNKKMLEKSRFYPFISIDSEGGNTSRYDFEKYETPKYIAKSGEKRAHEEYSKMAKTLSDMNFNLNFAPVVDLSINKNSIIEKKERSFSSNPKVVSKYAGIFIYEMEKYGILTSLKHFPGHGSAQGDTHLGFVDSTDTFEELELEPYYKLKNEAPFVMVSHIFNKTLDDKYPASLSQKTIKGILRDKIGYRGIIVSDDFDMGAIRDNYNLRDIVVNSINAGVDILIFSNNLKYREKNIHKKITSIVKKEIKKGNIKQSDIENSYLRITELKRRLQNVEHKQR